MSFAKEVWDTLSKIDVSEHIEKKDGLSYLSWAWAWGELKKHYPEASYVIHKDGWAPYFKDDCGYMCYVTVNIGDLSNEMWLPVMDFKNKAMKENSYSYKVWDYKKKQFVEKHVEAASMFDVNKTIMRCLVKCIAMFGLGHYIYAGEDLPEQDEVIEPNKNYAGDGSGLQQAQPQYLAAMKIMYEENDSKNLWCMHKMVGEEVWGTLRGELSKSLPKGEKIKGMEKLKGMMLEADEWVESSLLDMKSYIASEDVQGIKEMSELPKEVKSYVFKNLNQEEIEKLKSIKTEDSNYAYKNSTI